MPVPLAALPLLLAASPVLAASPLPADGFVPFTPPSMQAIDQEAVTVVVRSRPSIRSPGPA